MRFRRYASGVSALLLAASLGACGSTALKTAGGPGAPQAGGNNDGLTVTEGPLGGTTGSGAAPGSGAGNSSTSGSSPTGSTGTSGTSGTPGGAGTTGGSSGGLQPPTAAGPARPVKIGITYPDTAALAAAFGQESSDAKSIMEKIVNYINKTGGIAGRKIEPVWHKVDLAEDASTAGQRACTALTQDNKVDIVINGGVIGDTLPACLASAGVAVIDGAGSVDGVDEKRLRNRFAPAYIRLDRSVLGILNVSADRGLVKRGDTLGVLVEDCPGQNRIFTNIIQPRAQQLGLKVVQGTHKCVQNLVSDLGPVTNDAQREAVRFNGAGVTHVLMISGPEAFVLSQFTATASQQRYLPKYFVSSNAYPYNNTRAGAIVKIAEDARPNMTGAGTIPFLDVGIDARPANAAQQAAQTRCKKADPKEGTTAAETDPEQKAFTRSTYYSMCDMFYATKGILEANGVRFSLSDVTRGFQVGLSGNRTASANLSGGFFGTATNRLDGIGFVRPFAWDAKRGGPVYTGGAVPIP